MKLDLKIDGVAERIEIETAGSTCRFRLGDGDERTADTENPEPGVYSVILDGRSYDAHVEETPDALVVSVEGFRFEIEVIDPRRWSPKGAVGAGEGAQTISALMPGKVMRVLVSAGDAVTAGQGLIVVEAMKMQNEMKAPRAGRILAISAKEGATVKAGEVLVTLE